MLTLAFALTLKNVKVVKAALQIQKLFFQKMLFDVESKTFQLPLSISYCDKLFKAKLRALKRIIQAENADFKKKRKSKS